MKNILLGIVALFLAVLAVAAFIYSNPAYLKEQSMRKYNNGETVSETMADYIPPETTKPVSNEPYYAAAAQRMAERGIFPSGADFNPDAAVTRARFTQVICAALGLTEEAKSLKGKTDYVDVPENYWASGYINCATAHGLIGGVGDGFFGPEDVVLYEQAVKVALICLGEDEDLQIDAKNWATAYLVRAKKIGLTDGLAGNAGELLHCDDFAVLTDRIMETLATRDETTATTEAGTDAPTAATGTEPAETAATTSGTASAA